MTHSACSPEVLFRLCAIAERNGEWITLKRHELDDTELDALAVLSEQGFIEHEGDVAPGDTLRVRVTWNGHAHRLALQRELIV